MKSKQRAMSFAGISLAALLISGCAAGAQEVAEEVQGTDSASAGGGELNLAAQAWMIQKLGLEAMAEKFENDNPGISVNVVEYADNQALSTFSLQWSQGKSDQDLVVVDGASTAVQFVAQPLIVDFNKSALFEGDTAKDKFVGESLSFTELDGFQFAVPLGVETYNISANRSFFSEAGLLDAQGNIPNPESWEEVYEMAVALTERDGSGNVTRPGMTIQMGPNAVGSMLAVHQAVRGSFYKDDGETLTFDTPEMREVFQIWKRGVDEGVFSTDTFSDKDAGRNNFNAGNLPMLLQTAAHVPEAIPTIGEENSTVVAMPGSLENGSYGFSAGIIMPAASENQELAVRFIKEAMMSDLQIEPGMTWGKLPSITAHFDQIEGDWKTAMYDTLKLSQPAPKYRDLPQIQIQGKQLLQEYLLGQINLDSFLDQVESVIAKADKNPM